MATDSATTYPALPTTPAGVAFAEYSVEAAAAFIPSVGTIAANATPPVVAVVSPTPATAPGAAGGFPADYDAAAFVPIVLDVTDALPGLSIVTVVATIDGELEVVFFDDQFWGAYSTSGLSAIADGDRFTLRRNGGWPGSGSLGDVKLKVDAVDGAGNRTTVEYSWILPSSAAEVLEGSVAVTGIDPAEHVDEALARLPHYLAKLP